MTTELPTRPRVGVSHMLAAVVGALLVLAGFAMGRATSDDTVVASAPTTTTTIPPTSTTTTSTTTTTMPPPTTTTVASPDPVAEIAQMVGPAVVLIETSDGLGSGVVYRQDGYILTAAHVLGDYSDVAMVRFADGRQFEGTVIGAHEEADIAVVEIEAGVELPVPQLAPKGSTQVGQLAVALGSPFGLDRTVTAGIVSSVDRVVDGIAMVQTDAAINPGNSGGPLVDSQGRLIGINDLIFSETGENGGVGFAISIDLARLVADQIVDGAEPQLSYLGVVMSDGTGATPGAVIDRVMGGSPASEAGLQRSDIVVTVDGKPVSRSDQVLASVLQTAVGEVIEIEVIRDADVLTVPVTLGGR